MEKVRSIIESSKWKRMTPWAKANGLSPVLVHRYLKGRDLSGDNYLKLSDATGLPVEELIRDRLKAVGD